MSIFHKEYPEIRFKIDVIEKMPKRYIAVVRDKNMDKKAVSIFEEILVKYVKEQKDIAL